MENVCVVVGGGAAGVFAAIRCKELRPELQVILLEKTNQLLSKVRISGGGRCNVTHACFDPERLVQYYPRGSKELLGPFHRFQPKDTVAWFEKRGVRLKTEDDGRMFPVSDHSETIIECLMQAASDVEIRRQKLVLSMEKTNSGFLIQLKDEQLVADRVLLATGSSSWGYEIAQKMGHQIVKPVPSLFTLNVPTSPLLDLAGITVPHVILTLKETGCQQEGSLLLTHWGFSGPAALKLSAWAARELYELNYQGELLVNWTASPNQEALYESLLKRKKESPLEAIPPLLPNNLFLRLLASIEIDPGAPMGQISNKKLVRLAAKLYADSYKIEGKTTYKQEFVTAGGVSLKEIDFKTLQSRIVPGLFFAGEILNIDGVTGGFNFQSAWTTGFLAGEAMAQR